MMWIEKLIMWIGPMFKGSVSVVIMDKHNVFVVDMVQYDILEDMTV